MESWPKPMKFLKFSYWHANACPLNKNYHFLTALTYTTNAFTFNIFFFFIYSYFNIYLLAVFVWQLNSALLQLCMMMGYQHAYKTKRKMIYKYTNLFYIEKSVWNWGEKLNNEKPLGSHAENSLRFQSGAALFTKLPNAYCVMT